MRPRDPFWSHWEGAWGSQGIPGGQGGHPGGLLGPSGWFDKTSDDSCAAKIMLKLCQVNRNTLVK